MPLAASAIIFFFQAEDGIRDKLVTGVQTCALPISSSSGMGRLMASSTGILLAAKSFQSAIARLTTNSDRARRRSEERRVGKECRSRWSPDHYKKKSSVREAMQRADHDCASNQLRSA